MGIHSLHPRDRILLTNAVVRKRSHTTDGKPITNCFLSGVGKGIAWEGRAPPSTYDARDVIENEENFDTGDKVFAYKARYVVAACPISATKLTRKRASSVTGDEVVFPVHPVCWDLFLQNHALLAGPNACNPDLNLLGDILSSQDLEKDGRGLYPSWTKDYEGPEQFWADGWRHHEEPEASEVAGILDWSTEWDFLVKDPGSIEGFDDIITNPPLATTGKVSLASKVKPSNNSTCPFARLPQELLLGILTLLPTPSVGAVRVATPSMAIVKLSMAFWRSRFEFPNELSHITPPSTLSIGQGTGVNIDWIELRRRILGAPDDMNECLRNRRRIQRLTRLLVQDLLEKVKVKSEEKPE